MADILGDRVETIYGIRCPECKFEKFMKLGHAWNTREHRIEHILQCPNCELVFTPRDFDHIVSLYDYDNIEEVK